MNEQELIKALGPIAPLYADATICEILVDAHDRVYVERPTQSEPKIQDAVSPFASPEQVRAVIDAVLALGNVHLSSTETIGEVRLADGSRFLAILPPNTMDEPCFVLRRMVTAPPTWNQLIEWKSISRPAYEFLQSAIQARVNILVGGGTNSGKTTVANLLTELMPADQRVIVVEQIAEMKVRHPRCLHLEAGGPGNVSYGELVFRASCMRPDWLVVGALTGPEAMRAIQIMAHGHTAIATVHALGIEDALAQLEAMCLMANLGLGLGEIRRLIASAVRVVTYQELLPARKRRKVTHITELCGVENDRYVLKPLFRYDPQTDQLASTDAQPSWVANA